MRRRSSVEQYLASVAGQPGIQNEEYAACFNWLEGRLDKAKADFATSSNTRSSVSAALSLAMIYDDEKNAARRDEMLNDIVSKYGDKAPKTAAIVQLFLDSVFAPAERKKPLDVVALDRAVEGLPNEPSREILSFLSAGS